MNLEKLQSLVDSLVESEVGAELLVNVRNEAGAIAAMVVVPETSDVNYVLLRPEDELIYEPMRSFTLHDFMYEKAKNRVVLRSDIGNIYIVRPIQTDEARAMFTHHALPEEQYKEIKDGLTPKPTWAELHAGENGEAQQATTEKEAVKTAEESL